MPKNSKRSLVNPVRLAPYADKKEKGNGAVQVIVETPKGSRNKYSFNEDQRIFQLGKVLPAGMAFPYDFGFIPSTKAEDRDPIDVLLLMDESAFPGCLVRAKIIGGILGEQTNQSGEKERNDRLVAVAEKSHLYGGLKSIDELEDRFVKELEGFFVNYHSLDEKKFRVIRKCGPAEARKVLNESTKKKKKEMA